MSSSGTPAVAADHTYVDARHGLSFEVPPGWQIQRGLAGLLVSVVAPAVEGDAFRSNLNVIRRVRDRAPDLDALAHDAIKTLTRLLTDLLVVDVDGSVVAELPARRVLVAYRQGLYALTSEQWIVAGDDHIWTISAGAASDRWDGVTDIFAGIVRSMRVTS